MSVVFTRWGISFSAKTHCNLVLTKRFFLQNDLSDDLNFKNLSGNMLPVYHSKNFISSADINPTTLTNPGSTLSSKFTPYNKIYFL